MNSKLLQKPLIHSNDVLSIFLLHEWTRSHVVREGGWVVGDQKGPSIFLKIGHSNKQDVLIPNLVSKIVYGFKIKSNEQIKFEILRSISVT